MNDRSTGKRNSSRAGHMSMMPENSGEAAMPGRIVRDLRESVDPVSKSLRRNLYGLWPRTRTWVCIGCTRAADVASSVSFFIGIPPDFKYRRGIECFGEIASSIPGMHWRNSNSDRCWKPAIVSRRDMVTVNPSKRRDTRFGNRDRAFSPTSLNSGSTANASVGEYIRQTLTAGDMCGEEMNSSLSARVSRVSFVTLISRFSKSKGWARHRNV